VWSVIVGLKWHADQKFHVNLGMGGMTKKGCGDFQGVTRYKPFAPLKGLPLMDQNFHKLGGGNV